MDLDNLLGVPGAMAAFSFSERGELVDYRLAQGNDMGRTVLDMISHMCVANRAIAAMQARGWEQLTGAQGFYPVEGVSLIGFDWSVVSRGRLGVVLAND